MNNTNKNKYFNFFFFFNKILSWSLFSLMTENSEVDLVNC